MIKQKGGFSKDIISFFYILGLSLFIASIISAFINIRISAILLGSGFVLILITSMFSPFVKTKYN